ncbi:hypothetical protein [Victivallis sp.]|uniref:hypothetical protein n=1 Tax=Victivallis sp. TaxID=2049020 RepID=UPI003A8E8999
MKTLPSVSLLLLAFCTMLGAAEEASKPLFHFADMQTGIRKMGKSHYEIKDGKLRLEVPAGSPKWSGILLKNPDGSGFSTKGYSAVAFDVRNLGDSFSGELQVELICLGTNGKWRYRSKGGVALRKGESFPCRVPFYRDCGGTLKDPMLRTGIYKSPDGYPGAAESQRSHQDRIDEIRIFVNSVGWPGVEHRFELSDLRLENPVPPLNPELSDPAKFFPCIDTFGQYKHAKHRNLIHSDQELRESARREMQILQNRKPNPERTIYGGWANGPDFPATGHFYPLKYQGKWYLVDPTGKLFWGHGIQGIRWVDTTPITRREHWFETLPPKDDPLYAPCWLTERSGAAWYAKTGGKLTSFNYNLRNLIAKYGKEYPQGFIRTTALRLPAWGINLIGVNSYLPLTRDAKIPYIHNPAGKRVKLNNGKGVFFDVFDPGYARDLKAELTGRYGFTLNDPYCIGYCIDNEVKWGTTTRFAEDVVRSPASQCAKKVFLEQLQKRYHNDLNTFNQAWGSDLKSWNDFLNRTALPATGRGKRDLAAFNDEIIRTYFKVNREVLKECAPHKLYLGSRMHDYPVRVMRLAAPYLDVISLNLYRHSVADLSLPKPLDKPVLVTEYHFGLMDGGIPAGGIQSCGSRADRKHAYSRYVESALSNPYVIGVTYFQWLNQSAVGRYQDGENFYCGFVDVTDRPEPELVEAATELGQQLYRYRTGGVPAGN